MPKPSFDPNAASLSDSGIFGLPHTEKQSALVILTVPWEATTSYGAGTSKGPAAVLEASRQVDLFDLDVVRPYEAGIYMLPESPKVRAWNRKAKQEAAKVIRAGGVIGKNPKLRAALKTVNGLSEKLNAHVYSQSKKLLDAGKIVGILGGDHSVPFGALQAVAERHPSFGILHIDAHSDTRRAFEGFTWSHASIMYNVLENIPQVRRLVQLGIRDFCEEEFEYTRAQGERVQVLYDRELAKRRFEGETWGKITEKLIVSRLPDDVWISFDIDGLDPRFCPHTGTPVPGGLDFQEALHVLWAVARSGRRIIGFDLNEVAPHPTDKRDEWDANVGARLLYKLAALTLASQGRVDFMR